MKLTLTTLNSKFIHSCLSIRYLQGYVKDLMDVEIREYTINQSIDHIASDIYKSCPDIIGFSTYIWNLTETLKICEILKMVKPNIKIILGGPEVSFDGDKVLKNNSFIDFIIYGEGEETFREFVEHLLANNNDYSNIKGLIYRQEDKIIKNSFRDLMKDLNKIPKLYGKIGSEFENKIVYFESSRGCPFGCKFCLSSTIDGVRYFGIDRVKEEIGSLIDGKVGQVKFVDRTFNANKKYAMEIMNFIMEKNPENMNFHFEVTAHLLDEEMMEFLSHVKEGLFQFEVGVQSTNLKTIEAIGRTTDFEKLRLITKRIKSYKKIHQHLDLIAGLPYEDYASFGKSFNDVYEIKPEKIQLGFLKLLKGSELRDDEEKYGIRYLNEPPYEILKNDFLDYGEMIKLKRIEELVDRYYNEGYFENALEYVINNHYSDPFNFYEDFSTYWESNDYHKVSNSRNKLYEILIKFYNSKGYEDNVVFNDLILYDFIKNNKGGNIPKIISRVESDINQKNIHDILKDEKLLQTYLTEYKDLPTKKLIRDVAIENFGVNIFEIKENGHKAMDDMSETYILFVYKEGVINRCETYDITEMIKELI